jgi:hypothetical protein
MGADRIGACQEGVAEMSQTDSELRRIEYMQCTCMETDIEAVPCCILALV